MRRRGFFIVLEGPDGCGKSTQARLLVRTLRRRGLAVLHTREPGGTLLAEGIRRVLLRTRARIVPLAELFLYQSARAQHTQEKILPALRQGKVVVSERYTLSSLAYQGFGRGIPLSVVEGLNRVAAHGLRPDLTFLLDLPPQKGLTRRRALDRLEREALAFHQRVRRGYLSLARKDRRRICVVEAQGTKSWVNERLIRILRTRLSRLGKR